MLFGFATSNAAAYFLMRHLTGSRPASAAAAVLYPFCPYVLSHLSHIQLLMTGGVPLALLLLHRVADEAVRLKAEATGEIFRLKSEATEVPVASAFRRKIPLRGIWLGLALAAQALTCAYYGIFAGLAVGYGAL